MDILESLKEKDKRVFMYMRISASFAFLTTLLLMVVDREFQYFEVPIIVVDLIYLANAVFWIFLTIFSVWYAKIKKEISTLEKE